MSPLVIPVEQLPHARGLDLPGYATAGSAGLDLVAAVSEDEPPMLSPLGRALVPTGIRIALPEGFEAQLRPRSGLAAHYGITVLNAPGTIDSDYRGEISVILINLGNEPFAIRRGSRIAQMVISPVVRISWTSTTAVEVEGTDRGAGGFGSTG